MLPKLPGVPSILRPRTSSRLLATKVHRLPRDDDDFRPPWVYTGTRLLSYTVIPAVAFYAVFFHDFGDREHVFQPARRWAAAKKAAFFTLSPAEQQVLKTEASKTSVKET